MDAIEPTGHGAWRAYLERELPTLVAELEKLGFRIDDQQVHLGGERFLMNHKRDVGGGGRKLVLIGSTQDGRHRIVIKASSDAAGRAEITREREVRTLMNEIEFAYHPFATPTEFYFGTSGSYLISVTEYIEQELPLLDRPLEEQFFMILKALEMQEGVHATAHAHEKARNKLGRADAAKYRSEFDRFANAVRSVAPLAAQTHEIFSKGADFLLEHETTLARYCGFLTHADFIPNNFRIRGHNLYLLDHASIHFGNKYESWARLLNFMIHHNPELEHALLAYVRTNRSEGGYLALRLMRIYKVGYLLNYYAHALLNTDGPTHELMRVRFEFWTEVMQCLLDDRALPQSSIARMLDAQQTFRSEEEKARQREMIGRA